MATWQRRLLSLGRRLGVSITNVRPGVVLISRGRGRHRPQILGLADGTTVVGPSRPHLRSNRLGDDGWVVMRQQGRSQPRYTVDRLGDVGWLVSSAKSAAARLRLETRTGQLLAHRPAIDPNTSPPEHPRRCTGSMCCPNASGRS
jgi:hypothetical protein